MRRRLNERQRASSTRCFLRRRDFQCHMKNTAGAENWRAPDARQLPEGVMKMNCRRRMNVLAAAGESVVVKI